ncbi:porin, partial [Chitinimonas sp.]|uniref:porin n=1 Tax=Chitinimonas sp. TaxID=1934313 RepID=UPI002F94DABA
VGSSKIEADAGNGFDISKTDTTYSVFGGYQFHPNFAAEVAYRDLGKVDNLDERYKAHAIQASLVGSYAVSNEVSVFGRLGVASLKIEDSGPDFSDSVRKTKAVFGVGARYAVTKEFGIRGEYNQYSKLEGVKLSTWTIGGDYRF